ncbi:hypothetical protein CHS0354_004873 [Potamilus streckersoni]|uniref:Armadillo repeat-containing protein 8 n=1 Tax=Potamilus streckersoni TaxID=2493646 RepID=A0AAE0VX84_9BIVA|nr:hypothetical protein CHS0354_004873 [Potamilus streckersoni]
MIPSSMEVDGTTGWFDVLHSDEPEKWHDAVVWLKNSIIGNNKQKSNAINHGVIPRLLQWMIDDEISVDLRKEAAVVLGSIAKGTLEDIHSIVNEGSVPILLKGLNSSYLKYVEACLRCLRSIFNHDTSQIHLLYEDTSIVPVLLSVLPKSVCTQECITAILSSCCKTEDHQNILYRNGAVSALAPLLSSSPYKVQMPTLKCFAVMSYENEEVSKTIAAATYNGDSLPSLFVQLLSRDKTSEMQMAVAKCLTYMYRGGAMDHQDIKLKTLSTLVRMCSKDRTLEENVEGAETLAYLIEEDPELQQIASISDHIIKTLADYLNYTDVQQINTRTGQKKDVNWGDELKQAAFKAFASLGANDEDIRKKIIETNNLMEHIVCGLNSENYKVAMAAVRCLHSLSRSVQQLRTTFQDHAVWKPLMRLVQECPEEVLKVTSSTLCNLLLEFSPGREVSGHSKYILESGAISILVGLTKNPDPALRLNGIWGLMNMTFQAEQKIKTQIIEALGTDQLFKLLSDLDPNVLMKTLGLLRNILTNKLHIDSIMSLYGNQIMQAVVFILEGDHSTQVKEQTLCILANIADGDQAKSFIMENEDVLKKLMNYMLHTNTNLQIAATFCIFNLVWSEEEGAYTRQAKLRDLGVQKLLQQLLSTNDSTLFDKVKNALQQFT